VAAFADLIVGETRRINTLVDNLLESGRLSMGAAGAGLQPIDLRKFFHEYQEAVRNRFDLRQIDLRFEIQTRSVVMATSDTLQRIMDNLIDNALRFTEADGQIVCQVRDRQSDAEIVVADTGVGIPKTELTRIFERFHRLQREVDQRRKGTGLGLAIVRGLVEEMRGRIRAFSGDGEPGTRFEIHLPQMSRSRHAPDDDGEDILADDAESIAADGPEDIPADDAEDIPAKEAPAAEAREGERP
jgi:signal transduction histidine kinase